MSDVSISLIVNGVVLLGLFYFSYKDNLNDKK